MCDKWLNFSQLSKIKTKAEEGIGIRKRIVKLTERSLLLDEIVERSAGVTTEVAFSGDDVLNIVGTCRFELNDTEAREMLRTIKIQTDKEIGELQEALRMLEAN